MKRWMIGLLAILFIAMIAYLAITQVKPTITKTVQVTMTVMPKPDFTLDVGVAHVDVYPGRTATFVASLVSVNGFTGEIVVSIDGEPAGSVVSILPSPTITIGPGESRGCQIDIAVPDDSTLVGDYTITVTATSDTYN